MSTALGVAKRIWSRASWHSGGAADLTRVHLRSALARAGVPIVREFLELRCAAGNEASGFFSEFCAVLGGLAHYEAFPHSYAGFCVDFHEDGLYYDGTRGSNWWEYYFDPIAHGRDEQARLRVVPDWQHDLFADTAERLMPRRRAAALIERYVRIKPPIRVLVDRFANEHLDGRPTIGVHYRGTDKHVEEPLVSYERVAAAVNEAATAGTIFVATDDQHFVDFMSRQCRSEVVFRDVQRSTDGTPIHKSTGHGYVKGEEALVDCLLLARCRRLVRTPSNLGLVATFFNPDLAVTVLRGRE